MRPTPLALISFLALAACATGPSLQVRMSAYVGASEQTLVQGLGVPDKQVTVNGIQYFAYDRRYEDIETFGGFYGPFYGPAYGPIILPDTQVYACETTFLLQNGKVLSFTLRGNDCR